MSSIDKNFDKLREKIKKGRGRISNTGYDEFFYLVFSPQEILNVKKQVKNWMLLLKHDNWNVVLPSQRYRRRIHNLEII